VAGVTLWRRGHLPLYAAWQDTLRTITPYHATPFPNRRCHPFAPCYKTHRGRGVAFYRPSTRIPTHTDLLYSLYHPSATVPARSYSPRQPLPPGQRRGGLGELPPHRACSTPSHTTPHPPRYHLPSALVGGCRDGGWDVTVCSVNRQLGLPDIPTAPTVRACEGKF